jgi:hypothetical protein
MGLDHYEVRSFIGWYRHITLVLLALADFPGICATERFSASPPDPSPLPARPSVLPLTVPEVRHLLARLIWPSSSSVHRVLAWSWWRRCHQSHASYYHTKRRLDQLADPGWLSQHCSRLCAFQHSFPRYPRNFLEVPEFLEICFVLSPICSFLERSSEYDASSCEPPVLVCLAFIPRPSTTGSKRPMYPWPPTRQMHGSPV